MKSAGVFRAVGFEADIEKGMIRIPSENRQIFCEGERVRVVILCSDLRAPDSGQVDLKEMRKEGGGLICKSKQ